MKTIRKTLSPSPYRLTRVG